MGGREVYVTDMSQCRPSWALSRRWEEGKWTLIDYELEGGLRGTMLYFGSLDWLHEVSRGTYGEPDRYSDPPEVVCPLGLEGWHAVYLGIHYGPHPSAPVKVKLSSEEHFDVVDKEECLPKDGYFPEKMGFGPFDVLEAFWRYADLAGEDLVIAHPRGIRLNSNLTYVRLVPIAEDEAERLLREEAPRPDTRRLIAIFDGGVALRFRSEEDVCEHLKPFEGTDFRAVLWGVALGNICNYPTKVGDDRSRFDTLRVAVRRAHELGLEILASFRFEGPLMHFYTPLHELTAGRFYWENLHLRCLDEEGNPTNHLSLAYPEVRRHWIELMREALWGYGVDGVHVVFTRCHPFVLYERPVVEEFIERYGVDPRELDPRDERWLRHRASYVTQFLREVRAMLREAEAELGRDLKAAYHVMNSVANSLYFGLDVEAWVREGLVDYLIIHPCFTVDERVPTDWRVRPEFVREYAELVKGRCELYVDVYPRRMPAEAYRLKAIEYYEAGADGLCFWDTNTRFVRKSEWRIVTRLGHREELRSWARKTRGVFRVRRLKKLAGMTVDMRYSFTDG